MGDEFLNYQKAVESVLKTQFPDMNTISVFAKITPEECSKPAIVFQLPVMETSPNSTIQNFILTLKNTAFVIYTLGQDPSGFICQQLSANLANFIRYNTFGGTAMPAAIKLIAPSKIEGLHNVVVQKIDFTQDLQIFAKS